MSMKLTAKMMEEGLKHGWTCLEFCDSLNLKKDQLISSIEKTFSSRAASSYIRKMKKNEKKPLTKKDEKIFFIDPVKVSDSESKHEPNFVTEIIESKTDVQEKTANTVDKSDLTLEDLQDAFGKINGQIAEFEKKKKDLNSENSLFRKRLLDKMQQMKDIKKQFKNVCKEAAEIQQLINNNNVEISALTENISKHTTKREKITEQIKEIQKVTILLGDDGSIEPELDIPDSWQEKYQQLLSEDIGYDDIIDKLTRAQIKQVAMVLSAIEKLEFSYEYISDSPSVIKLLDSILGLKK